MMNSPSLKSYLEAPAHSPRLPERFHPNLRSTIRRMKYPEIDRNAKLFLASGFHFAEPVRGLVFFEIFHFEELPHFNLRIYAFARGIRKTTAPFHRFFLRFDLNHGVSGNQLFRFRKGAVNYRALLPRILDAPAFRSRLQARGIQQHSRLDQFLVVSGHGGEAFLLRHHSRFGILRCLYYDHESHRFCSLSAFVWQRGSEPDCPAPTFSTDASNQCRQNRHFRQNNLSELTNCNCRTYDGIRLISCGEWQPRRSSPAQAAIGLACQKGICHHSAVFSRRQGESMKKRMLLGILLTVAVCWSPRAQEVTIAPTENLVSDGIAKIPASLVETAGRYGSYRSANFVDWNPAKREMLVSTRFADTPQLHLVSQPGGARQQLTFFPDAVTNGRFHLNGGDYLVFSKDIGGGEWYQLYRYDVKTGDVTLLTDGKARNLRGPWSSGGDQLAYVSTRRTGKDTDLWVMNPADPKTDHLLTKLEGGGWEPLDWSPDDKKILLKEELSINEAYLWLVDTATGEKTPLTPRDSKEKVSYSDGQFSKDGKGIYVTTDKSSEFHRLAYLDLVSKEHTYLTSEIPWDVETFDISHDGKQIAFVANEAGVSALYDFDATKKIMLHKQKLPTGIIGALRWHANGRDLGFSLTNARGPGDAYSVDVTTGTVERWTTSETAAKTDSFTEAELVKWKSFDGKMISGFLYKPAAKFTGKRPVLVVIHGGPEGQSQPTFLGRNNFYLNELGIALIYPNVRGSTC